MERALYPGGPLSHLPGVKKLHVFIHPRCEVAVTACTPVTAEIQPLSNRHSAAIGLKADPPVSPGGYESAGMKAPPPDIVNGRMHVQGVCCIKCACGHLNCVGCAHARASDQQHNQEEDQNDVQIFRLAMIP
jgi:hypothetical protein